MSAWTRTKHDTIVGMTSEYLRFNDIHTPRNQRDAGIESLEWEGRLPKLHSWAEILALGTVTTLAIAALVGVFIIAI